jgi:hypothetical protein
LKRGEVVLSNQHLSNSVHLIDIEWRSMQPAVTSSEWAHHLTTNQLIAIHLSSSIKSSMERFWGGLGCQEADIVWQL